MPSIYETLTEKAQISPEEGEKPQVFYERLFRAVNALEEGEWDQLPDDAQLWANDASDALTAKQPIQTCPGAPFEQEEAEAEAEAEADPAPPKRAADKKTPAKAPAKAAAKAKDKPAAKAKAAAKPKEKAAAKPKAPKTPKEPKAPREKKVGVLDLLMEAVYHHPAESPQELADRVSAANPGLEVKIANSIGIRQQYRRITEFLKRKGHIQDLVTK